MTDLGHGGGLRREPAYLADERGMLDGWLDYYRATLSRLCDGLPGAALVRPAVEPSRLTLLGLVRHMAENERRWFRRNAAGHDLPDLYCSPDHPDGDFTLIDPNHAMADLAIFRAEVGAARDAVRPLSLDHTFTDSARDGEVSLRWAYVLMLGEYTRHCGHGDLIRERIDGRTGL